MWYPATIAIEPTTDIITLDAAKKHCRVDHDDDDEYFESLIEAAVGHVEAYCGASFSRRTIDVQCTSFGDFCHVPASPLASITSVQYVIPDGTSATLADTVYSRQGQAIVLKYGQAWPGIHPGSLITVRAVVGFEACPPAVRHAALLWISSAYEMRESEAMPPWTTLDALLCNHRYY